MLKNLSPQGGRMVILLTYNPIHPFALTLDLDMAVPLDTFHCVMDFNVKSRSAVELAAVRATNVSLFGCRHGPHIPTSVSSLDKAT